MNWIHARGWSLPFQGRSRDKKSAPDSDDTVREMAAIRRRYGTKGLYEVIEGIAFDYRCRGPGSKAMPPAGGLGIDKLLARYRVRSGGLDKLVESQGQRILTQFALFTQGKEHTIDFAHPTVADFLAGRFALRALQTAPDDACQVLGGAEPDDAPVFFGYLRREVAKDAKLNTSLRRMAASPKVPADCKSRIARIIGD
jgi:hypothetical protein